MQELQLSEIYTLEIPHVDGSRFEVAMPTFAERDKELLTSWLYGKAEKTQKAYLRDIQRFYQIAKIAILDIRQPDVIQNFAMQLSHLKIASRNRAVAAVKSVVTYGHIIGVITFNAGAVVKLEKVPDELAERILSERSIERMLATEEKINYRNYIVLALLYYAGLRAHEVCNLRWKHVQERDDSGQLSIFGKGKKTRHILLDTGTWNELQSIKPSDATPDTYVCQSRQTASRTGAKGKRLDESRIEDIVKEAAIRESVEVFIDAQGRKNSHVSPHWLRHAHATYAQERGASIALVKDTLGHGSVQTTIRYSHVRPNDSSTKVLRREK